LAVIRDGLGVRPGMMEVVRLLIARSCPVMSGVVAVSQPPWAGWWPVGWTGRLTTLRLAGNSRGGDRRACAATVVARAWRARLERSVALVVAG